MTSDTEERRWPVLRSGLAALIVSLVALAAAGAVLVIGNEQDERGPADSDLTAKQVEGRQLFNESCSQCHTLGQVNAVQTVGPNLDALRPPKALVLDAIENGRARGQGNMPGRLVTGEDADAVAEYVAAVAGKSS